MSGACPGRPLLAATAALVLALGACTGGPPELEPASPPSPSPAGELRAGLPLGDHSFDLYLPAGAGESGPVPAVIALHGNPGSSVEGQARLQPLADEAGFLVAYPRVGRPRWQPELDSPDVDLVRDLVAELVGEWDADPDRIYVTGMSAGADMAIAVGLQLGDLVAAVAPVAPPADPAVAELVDRLGTPIPMVAFVGADDARFADRSLALFDSWRERAECEEEERSGSAEVATHTWQCPGGAEMTVHVLGGQGHVWFGSPQDREPLWASEAMWEFFTTSAAANRAYHEVEFAGRDGDLRAGRRFGDGPVAVVLSHMGRSQDSQEDWAAFAEELAGHGYQVLTYDRRPTSADTWLDVLGAADQLRDGGAETVIAAGASLGAMATLYAATQPDAELDGVIWLAGVRHGSGYSFQEAEVAGIACPMLFISGDQDGYGAADDTRQLYEWATAPSELLILDSRRHGTDIFAEGDPNAGELSATMLAFVEHVATEPTDRC